MYERNRIPETPNCERHVKCLTCAIGKAYPEDIPNRKERGTTVPLYQVNMDSFYLQLKSIEEYQYAMLFVVNYSSDLWIIYRMRTRM
jgi:hypothetical protein